MAYFSCVWLAMGRFVFFYVCLVHYAKDADMLKTWVCQRCKCAKDADMLEARVSQRCRYAKDADMLEM